LINRPIITICSQAAALVIALVTPLLSIQADCTQLQGEVIRWVVPTRPGGGYDRYSRLIEPFLEERLDAQIVIENRTEAGGVVGAITIKNAQANGRTIGIINASGLLAANALLDSKAPDPIRDYSVLAKVARNHMFVFTGSESGIGSIENLLVLAESRPIVVGVRDVGSVSFFAVPIAAELLGMDYAVVPGYVGSTGRVLAAIRGEIDIIFQNYDSVRSYVESGELRPLLQITERRGAHTVTGFPGTVPLLGGQNGLAAQQAKAKGENVETAVEMAAALAAIQDAGRLVVAPTGLSPTLKECLQTALMGTLLSPELDTAARQAGLSIEAASAAEARAELIASLQSLNKLGELVRSALERTRL